MFNYRISEELSSRLASVNKIIDWCEKCLTKAPPGRLKIKHQDGKIYFYQLSEGKNPKAHYLDSSQMDLIKALAQKAYIKELLRKALSEKRMLTEFLGGFSESSLMQIYEDYSQDRKDLITPFTLPDEEFKQMWLSKEYKRKSISEELPVYETLKGDRVRSKSEQIIADRLYVNNIPYKYECPLPMDDFVVHPDFTILRMSDRREIYYEHFGRMDDVDYANKNTRKIINYNKKGIVLGDNLFVTMETLRNPLDVRVLDNLIQRRFR